MFTFSPNRKVNIPLFRRVFVKRLPTNKQTNRQKFMNKMIISMLDVLILIWSVSEPQREPEESIAGETSFAWKRAKSSSISRSESVGRRWRRSRFGSSSTGCRTTSFTFPWPFPSWSQEKSQSFQISWPNEKTLNDSLGNNKNKSFNFLRVLLLSAEQIHFVASFHRPSFKLLFCLFLVSIFN